MSCNEFGGDGPNDLRSYDFVFRFPSFERNTRFTATAINHRARPFVMEHVEGTVGEMAEAKAGDMFSGVIEVVEDLAYTQRTTPNVFLQLDNGYRLDCFVEIYEQGTSRPEFGWGMIVGSTYTRGYSPMLTL